MKMGWWCSSVRAAPDGVVQGEWKLKNIAGDQTLITKAFDGTTIQTYDTITVTTVLPPPAPIAMLWIFEVCKGDNQHCSHVGPVAPNTDIPLDVLFPVVALDSVQFVAGENVILGTVTDWTIENLKWSFAYGNAPTVEPTCRINSAARTINCDASTLVVRDSMGVVVTNTVGQYILDIVSGDKVIRGVHLNAQNTI
jgi:hypothetical protein